MAIDPKELRIGSHVDVNGFRVRVGGVYKESIVVYTPYDVECENHVIDLNRISSIPITPELLTELGFCKKMYGDDWSMWTKDFDSFSISVGIQNSECKGANIKDNNDEYAMFGWSYPCKYLHELESFYYHCTKQELIND